jgi:hypothetical protein
MVINTHHWVNTTEAAAAAAMNATCDMDLGSDQVYAQGIPQAVGDGTVSISAVDEALVRLMTLRFRLGEFDPPALVPYRSIGAESLDTAEHRAANVDAARKGLVLLQRGSALPLAWPLGGGGGGGRQSQVRKLAVVGPSANDTGVLLGNYPGIPGLQTTVLEGIQALAAGFGVEAVTFAAGCSNGTHPSVQWCPSSSLVPQAVSAAQGADTIVAVLGLAQDMSKEGIDWASSGDCDGQAVPLGMLPGCQMALLAALREALPTTPIVAVIVSGNPVWFDPAAAGVDSLLWSGFPGSLGGQAIAEVLFGLSSPAGRLPFTVPANYSALRPVTDVQMDSYPGWTYRYYNDTPLFSFGTGMSYTNFNYSDLALSAPSVAACASLAVTVRVSNTGAVDSDEVVQLYVAYPQAVAAAAGLTAPRLSLQAYQRVHIPAQRQQTVTLSVPPEAFTVVDAQGLRQVLPGTFTIAVGGQQPLIVGGQVVYSDSDQGRTLPLDITTPGETPFPFAEC